MTFRDRFALRKITGVSISRLMENGNPATHRRKSRSNSKADRFKTQRRKSSIARAHADIMYRNLYPRFDSASTGVSQHPDSKTQTRPSIITSSWVSSQQCCPASHSSRNQKSQFQNYVIGFRDESPLSSGADEPHSPTAPGMVFPELYSLEQELPPLPKRSPANSNEYTAQQLELVKVIEAKLGIHRSRYNGCGDEQMFGEDDGQNADESVFAEFFSYARSMSASRQDSSPSLSNSTSGGSGVDSESQMTSISSCGKPSFSAQTPQPRLTTFDDLIRWGSMDTSKDCFETLSDITLHLKASDTSRLRSDLAVSSEQNSPWPLRQSSLQPPVRGFPSNDTRRKNNDRGLNAMFRMKGMFSKGQWNGRNFAQPTYR